MMYHVTARIGDGLITVTSRYGQQPWVRAQRGTVRPTACCRCRVDMPKGVIAYRPIANPVNRSDRMCRTCAEPQSVQAVPDA